MDAPPPRRLLPSVSPSFLNSDRRLARFAQPVVRFLLVEAAGGLALVAASLVALVWANGWPASYESVWTTGVHVAVGGYEFDGDLHVLVNDLLMALFFFVVGMEVKREIIAGELRDRRAIALPAMAALGGMIAPALLYSAVAGHSDGSRGWGVPMATDIAFALGVVALLGRKVPSSVKVLLLTLAIVDDIGAIIVIAVFYSSDVELRLVLAAAVVTATVAVLHRLDVTSVPVLLGLGFALWLVLYESGAHATLAGVAMGLLTPGTARQSALEADDVVDVLANREDVDAADVRMAAWAIRGSVSACDRLLDVLHPWTSYVVVPVFALANAGVRLDARAFTDPSAVMVGVIVGLVIGKLVGVTLFSWIAVRIGIGRLPSGAGWGDVVGVAATAGIGFTVSLFVTGLAFERADLAAASKLGTLVASVTAASLGAAIFTLVARRRRKHA